MPKPTVYLETTIPSYLAAFPSGDLIVAAHQQITHQWWRHARDRFDVFISEAVLGEIQKGDPDGARRRLEVVQELDLLKFTPDVEFLRAAYEQRLELPPRARADALHMAYAVASEMDYLLTWNCRHIANGEAIRRLFHVNAELGRPTPTIVTPDWLIESSQGAYYVE